MSIKIERPKMSIERSALEIKRGVVKIQKGNIFDIRDLLEADGLNPLDEIGEVANGLEKEQSTQMDAVVSSVREDRQKYKEYHEFKNDPRFYCVLVFQSEEQKLEFIQKAGWQKTTEFKDHSFDDMYLNGLEVARRMGIEVTKLDLPQGYRLRGNPEKYREEVIPDD